MLYIRKVSLSKWTQLDYTKTKTISADAITGCIRTSQNTLSLWQLHDKDAVEDTAALALISGLQSIEKIDLVIIDGDELGLSLEDTKGHTAVPDLVDTHTDITSLNYETLGTVAHYISKQLQDEENIIQITKPRVKEILLNAIENGRVEIDLLDTRLKEKLNII